VTEVAQLIGKRACIEKLEGVREKSQAEYDTGAKCLLDAKNTPTINECLEDMVRPEETVRRLEEMNAQRATQEKRQAQLQAELEKMNQLTDEMTRAKDDATRAAAMQKFTEAKSRFREIQNGTKPKAPCACPPGDPLCSCIPSLSSPGRSVTS
jgi:hypothetical protein